ncbi:MAG: ceramidase domain-containing protein, partial [Planctomycetota bacterium]
MKKNLLVISIALSASMIVFLFPAIPQDQKYHQFADQRTLLGIPNFWNVISNLPFVIAGLIGLVPLLKKASLTLARGLYWAYVLFFAGTLLVGFGSGFYHLDPSDTSLVWDRLPMTVAFMSFFAVIIGERISVPAARRLLSPMLAVGIFSVGYWYWTEQ